MSELTSKERKRVYTALYQSHLPTLEKQGLVKYDQDRGVAEITDPIAEVDIYLEVVPKESIPWSLYYLGLSILSGLLLLFAHMNLYPFNNFPGLVWGAVILVAFALSAFLQLYQSRRMRIGDEGPPPEVKTRT